MINITIRNNQLRSWSCDT